MAQKTDLKSVGAMTSSLRVRLPSPVLYARVVGIGIHSRLKICGRKT